jgi:hypothetical protein
MVEHGAHLAHRAHLAAEKAEKAGHVLEPLVEAARREQAARTFMQAHSQMAVDLRLMRRGIAGLERAAANGGNARVVAKLKEAKAAYAAAMADFQAERANVAVSSRFVAEYSRSAGSAKGAALAKLGRQSFALEETLQASRMGRGLLATGKVIANPHLIHGLMVVGAALDGINGYAESTATTTTGKVANGALAAGSSALLMYVPVVAGADMLVPKGYKPSEVLKGGAGAVTAIGEGVMTGDTRAMEAFHERSKSGEYGKVVQAASEAGDYWAEKGVAGGLSEFADAVRWWLSR